VASTPRWSCAVHAPRATDERKTMPTKEIFTIEDLKRILREGAGADEGVDLDGDIADVEFGSLGYESLALLETSSRIEREYGIRLDEEAVATANTPRALVDLVSTELLTADAR
jgi:act minimal PKS acyl carrier protein